MANASGKHIDHTHLSIDQAEKRGFIHRDYIAHCLRWSHVAKYLAEKQRYKTARVLDVGCGVDLPMARMLYSSRYIVEEYVGVDYNPDRKFVDFNFGKMKAKAYGDQAFPDHFLVKESEDVYSFAEDGTEAGARVTAKLPTIITCFEVLEHVEPARVIRMLSQMHSMLRNMSGSVAFLSTPCWDPNVGAADNHVNEMTYEALGALLEDMGFGIQGVWGTFASQRDYKHLFIKDHGEALWAKLSEYYDSNYIATLFAPMYPQFSRNCLWQVSAQPQLERRFKPLTQVEGRWTSSEQWEELAGV